MQRLILFTNMSSIKKYWETSLSSSYLTTYISDYKKLTEYLVLHKEPLMILLDELSIKNIQEAINELSIFKHVKLLLLHSLPEVHHAATLLSSKISAYENTYSNKANLLQMLKTVEDGKQWLFKDLTYYIVNKFIEGRGNKEPEFMELLTIKEKEIALMISEGYTNKEISQAEKIALSTVKGHIQKIFEKAKVSDRVALVLKFK